MKRGNGRFYRFDNFELDEVNRQLRRGDIPVTLSPKAFDLLVALVKNDGQLVGKEDLFATVWRDQTVEESNLTVHVSQIRKALGETKKAPKYIETVPGYGYRFIGDLLNGSDHGSYEGGSFIDQTDDTGPANSNSPPRWLLPLAALLTLVLVIVAAAFFYYRLYKNVEPGPTTFTNARVKQLTTKGQVRWVALSPDGRLFGYSLAERNGRRESLWLGQTDGGGDIQLRPNADISYRNLVASPDGKALYFTLNGEGNGEHGLFKIPILGGTVEKISDTIREYFSISPDGRQAAFVRTSADTQRSAVVIANLDGTAERELLTRPVGKNFSINCVAWSPDGASIAVAAVVEEGREEREIFIVRLSDGQSEQLTSFNWSRISNLLWQRDGRGLIMVANSKDETLRHLWQVDLPGGAVHRLSRDVDSYGSALTTSADGRSLVAAQLRRESNVWTAPADDLSKFRQVTFSSANGIYGWDGFDWIGNEGIVFPAGIDRSVALYSMDADGNGIRQLTSAGFYDQRPSVTADGRFIVFQSNRTGGSEIWRARIDGSDLRPITTGGGNTNPHVTPDGKWVIYTLIRETRSFIMRVPIDGGEPVALTGEGYNNPRVSPDGKLIACSFRAEDRTGAKLVILDSSTNSVIKTFDVPRAADFYAGIRWTADSKTLAYRDRSHGIWTQKIDGSPAQKVTGLPDEPFLSFGWSGDGKTFAFAYGRTSGDAVLLTGDE